MPRIGLICRLLTLSGLAAAAPFSFPLENGFPFPSPVELDKLFTRAGGNFSNAPLAPKFDDDSLTSWKLQAFAEFMSVAFYTQLISNITDEVPGFEVTTLTSLSGVGEQDSQQPRRRLLHSLASIQAQEEMQAYNANDAVRNFADGLHIYPCIYVFPVTDLSSALQFATTMTDMYIGLLINVQQRTAKSLGEDSAIIEYVLAQALAQKGQQSGWLRGLQGKVGSAGPFVTSSSREYELSWLMRWVVKGSCPNVGEIPVDMLPVMNVVDVDVNAEKLRLEAPGKVVASQQKLALINGQQRVIIVSFEEITRDACASEILMKPSASMRHRQKQQVIGRQGGTCQKQGWSLIEASFPYAKNVLHGPTLASVIQADDYEKIIYAEDATKATVFGPAIIEIA